MHDRESKRGEKRGPNVRVLIVESLGGGGTPGRKRSEHGGSDGVAMGICRKGRDIRIDVYG